jgi:hypothetical protein
MSHTDNFTIRSASIAALEALVREKGELKAEVERLRIERDTISKPLHMEIERLTAALQQIVTEADSDDGLTAWDGADIARRALEKKR